MRRWTRDNYPWVYRNVSHKFFGSGVETQASVLAWLFARRGKNVG